LCDERKIEFGIFVRIKNMFNKHAHLWSYGVVSLEDKVIKYGREAMKSN